MENKKDEVCQNEDKKRVSLTAYSLQGFVRNRVFERLGRIRQIAANKRFVPIDSPDTLPSWLIDRAIRRALDQNEINASTVINYSRSVRLDGALIAELDATIGKIEHGGTRSSPTRASAIAAAIVSYMDSMDDEELLNQIIKDGSRPIDSYGA